ncbi:MAG TPA: hypothetical protein VE907_06805 [Gammaproteobacteria bacterium]|nr:hypothetical protein [Gammaproteobacteria bacterium]
MNKTVDSARRRFIWNAGAALSAPLAVVASSASASTTSDESSLNTRLAMLEDANAIREVARAYVKHVNAGAHAEVASLCTDPAAARLDGIRALTADPHGHDDAIDIAADRRTATARISHAAETERPIEPPCPLVEMARAQGGGVTRKTERGVLEGSFVKIDGVWKIERAAFRTD